MSQRDMPVCPGASWYIEGRVPSRVPVCSPRIFSRTISLSAFTGDARRHLAEEVDACISISKFILKYLQQDVKLDYRELSPD